MFVHPSEAHSRVNTGKGQNKPYILYKNTIFSSRVVFYQADKGADGKDLMSVVERKDLSLL